MSKLRFQRLSEKMKIVFDARNQTRDLAIFREGNLAMGVLRRGPKIYHLVCKWIEIIFYNHRKVQQPELQINRGERALCQILRAHLKISRQ